MNFQSWQMKAPLRIMVINPLVDASKLAVIKLLSQRPFGNCQLMDIILLVYANELYEGKQFVHEIIACSFDCLNTIVVTSDLPSITDADIFCCITNFPNPNSLDFQNLETEEHFDTFYLYIKVALSLGKSFSTLKEKEEYEFGENDLKRKPIFFGDGLVVLDIIHSFGAENMAAAYICHIGVPSLARSTLAEYLKVRCTDINTIYVWGATHEQFYVEVEKPYIKHDKISDSDHCDWEMVSKDVLNPLQLDSTQFNASWMRKEFIIKLKEINNKNPCGPIFRAWKLIKCISTFACSYETGTPTHRSVGLISDGSLRTIKGLPYFLPVIKDARKWTIEINPRFGGTPFVVQEIKRFNTIVKERHEKLIKYCRKFMEENIIGQNFVPLDAESGYTSFTSAGTNLD